MRKRLACPRGVVEQATTHRDRPMDGIIWLSESDRKATLRLVQRGGEHRSVRRAHVLLLLAEGHPVRRHVLYRLRHRELGWPEAPVERAPSTGAALDGPSAQGEGT